MGVTCVLISTGRLDHLQSSIASFLAQDYADKQLIVVSQCFRQKLQGDLPNVQFINSGQMLMAMRCKNIAVENSRHETIILWSEIDYYLPNHLSRVASKIAGRQWVWFEREWHSENRRHLKAQQGSESVFPFTKEAWQKVGGFKAGVNGADDRNFIARVTAECDGAKIPTSPGEITFVRVGSEVERSASRPDIRSGAIKIEPLATRDFRSQITQFLTGRVENKICVVLLGRYGDITCILPYLKLIADNYEIPSLVVSQEFADLLEGISYAKAFPLQIKNEEAQQALRMAKDEFQIVINATVWGKGHSQKRVTTSYNQELWANCGIFSQWDNKKLIPVFDRRDPEREALLLRVARKDDSIDQPDMRPMILVNVSKGISSPCDHCGSLLDEIKKLWGLDCNIVNLAEIRAHRLYDFLILMENAACLCSIDTSFLHLAAATNVPIIALVNPIQWGGTEVRGNLITRMTYEEVKESTTKVHEGIAAALASGQPAMKQVQQWLLKKPVAVRVFNLIDKFEDTDPKVINRKSHAIKSQDDLYENGALIPIHVWEYPRTADKTLGDPRKLPYLKDLFQKFLDVSDENDVCIWCNDDSVLHQHIVEHSKFMCGVYGACSFFRSEFNGNIPALDGSHEEFARQSYGKHIGRDAFAFSHAWLVQNWDEIPDMILGAANWDLCMAALIRLTHGIKTTSANLGENMFPAEAPNGLVGHLAHASLWNLPTTQKSPSNAWNGKLFREWSKSHGLELKFNAENNLA